MASADATATGDGLGYTVDVPNAQPTADGLGYIITGSSA